MQLLKSETHREIARRLVYDLTPIRDCHPPDRAFRQQRYPTLPPR